MAGEHVSRAPHGKVGGELIALSKAPHSISMAAQQLHRLLARYAVCLKNPDGAYLLKEARCALEHQIFCSFDINLDQGRRSILIQQKIERSYPDLDLT